MALEKIRFLVGMVLLVFLVSLGFYKPVVQYLQIPNQVTVLSNQVIELSNLDDALEVSIQPSDESSVQLNQNDTSVVIQTEQYGSHQLVFEYAGLPIKKVDVKVLEDFRVIPGGQSIGVKLNTAGILVVGHHQIRTENGKVSPGELAGIKVGDLIVEINGKKIEKTVEISDIVQQAGKDKKPLLLKINREESIFSTELLPQKEVEEDTFKLGLYIRDSAAGIGTMTFFEPNSKKYGALGHVISDMDTKKPIVVNNGEIVRSTVTSIEKGSNGNPGEKLARFSSDKEVIGDINRNSPYGIFGELNQKIKNNIFDQPIPIALSSQVKTGKAQILTVVENDEVEVFDIEIVSSIPQKFPATKGMVIKITDPRLIEKTGGIVQGMSGSPIIQGGILVGAVTHVFVNDPLSGYGVHIEWMLKDAGINIYEKSYDKAS